MAENYFKFHDGEYKLTSGNHNEKVEEEIANLASGFHGTQFTAGWSLYSVIMHLQKKIPGISIIITKLSTNARFDDTMCVYCNPEALFGPKWPATAKDAYNELCRRQQADDWFVDSFETDGRKPHGQEWNRYVSTVKNFLLNLGTADLNRNMIERECLRIMDQIVPLEEYDAVIEHTGASYNSINY